MTIVKNIVVGILSLGIKVSLFLVALLGSLYLAFGTPRYLKQSLVKSTFYDSAVNAYIVSMREASQNGGLSGQSSMGLINDPRFSQIANDALPPQVLQSKTEQAIDGMYAWLNSEQSTPAVTVDLTESKNAFIRGLADYAAERVRALPVCSSAELEKLQNNIDPYVTTCRPASLSADQVRNEVLSQYSNNNQFIGNPVIRVSDLQKGTAGIIFNYLPQLHAAFKAMATIPFVLAGLVLLCVFALVSISSKKRASISSLGWSFIGIAVFLFLNIVVIGYVFSRSGTSGSLFGGPANNQLAILLAAVTNNLGAVVNKNILLFCAAYAGIGASLLLVLAFTKPKDNGFMPTTQQTTANPLPTVDQSGINIDPELSERT